MKTNIKNSLVIFLLLFTGIVYAQSGGDIVRGKITEKGTGEPLIMVTVAEVDPNGRIVNGVASNMDGEYAINIKSSKNSLQVTYLGYQTQTLKIGDKRVINIIMGEDSQMLQEAVIVGKAMANTGGLNIPTREITTAVQKINTKEFEGLQVTSIDDALQGRIAGLDIVASSGEPGAGMSMKIRGTATITGNTQPLIVVNGVPYEADVIAGFDFNNATDEQFANLISVNPEDILDIAVYKDAASTAVWGSKGANGVLEITTKKGATGKTRLTYTYRGTYSKQPKGLKLLNGDDYTMLMKQAYYNMRLDPNATAHLPELNYVGIEGFSEYENFNNNTDWVKSVSQTAWINSHNLAIDGGGERAKYRISGEILNQPGTVIGQLYERFSTRSYLEYDVSTRIKFISEFGFTYGNNDKNYVDDNNKSSVLDIAYRKMPNVSIYAQDRHGNNTGKYYNILQSSELDDSQKNLMNPVALARLATYNDKNYRITPTFRLDYYLLDPEKMYLKYSGLISFDIDNLKTSKFLPKEVSSYIWDNENVNRAEEIDSKSLKVQTDNKILWQPRFSNPDHFLSAGFTLRTSSSTSEAQRIVSLGLSKISDPSSSAYLRTISSSEKEGRSMSVLGQSHYSYKSKYILGLSLIRDGSSRFGRGNQWGTFYGVSGKWIVSDETLWEPLRKVVNEFALRPTYGSTGNRPGDEYLAYSRYANYDIGYLGNSATYPKSIQLTNLKWETTTEFNVGSDIHLFDSKLIFDLNYYKRKTKDLLFSNLDIPTTSGYGTLSYQNVGSMDNEGWEVYINAVDVIKTGKFEMSFNVNFANSVNKIIELSDAALNALNADYNGSNGSYLTRVQVNNAYGSIYGFRYKGVYQYDEYNEVLGHTNAPVARDKDGNVIFNPDGTPKKMIYNAQNRGYTFQGGDAIYEDVNHDGAIDELDIVYLGNSNPKLTGGFGTSFSYKKFYCTMFFNFRYGNKIINNARMNAENMYTNDNQSIAVNWRWRKNGDVTEIPRAVYKGVESYNWLGSDRFVEDGSFLRFKYLTFGYEVPAECLRPLGVRQLALSLTFNNLYCFTKYTGVDPEISQSGFRKGELLGVSVDKSKTPRPQEFTLNLKVGF